MAILLKVKWVDQCEQPDPHERITHIGGNSREMEWKHSLAQAIQSIEEGRFCYYVEEDARVLQLEVGVAPDGHKFLKTPADGNLPKSLLDLPEFPKSRVR